MHLIEDITDEPHQRHVLLFEGEQINLELRYMAATEQWLMNLQYLTRNITNIALVGGSPLLRGQLLPFDFAVTTGQGIDPFTIDAFSNGRCELWFVTPEELAS